MTKEFRMQGYMIEGELHVREADCRRAVSDALQTGKEELIASHDDLVEVLQGLVSDLRELQKGGEEWSPATLHYLNRAEMLLAKAARV